MDLNSFRLIFRACNVFGLSPYKAVEINGKKKLCVSSVGVVYSILAFGFHLVLVGMIFINNLREYKSGHFDASFKVKILYFTWFTISALTLNGTVLVRKKLICETYNFFGENFPLEANREVETFNRRIIYFQTCLHSFAKVLIFFKKVFPLLFQISLLVMAEWTYLMSWSWAQDFLIAQVVSLIKVGGCKFEKIGQTLIDEGRKNKGSATQLIRQQMAEDMHVKDYVDIVCGLFGFTLLCYFSQVFITVTSLSVMILMDRSITLADLFGFLVYISARLLPMIVVLESTRKKAEKTANHVHELFLDYEDLEFKEEIEIFSLQLQHRKVEFSACGFFPLDFTLLYSMVGAVTTYIIILMQFQKEDSTSLEENVQKTLNCSILFHYYTIPDVYRCLNTSAVLA